MRLRNALVVVLVAVLAGFTLVCASRQPSNDRNWAVDQKVLARAVIRGEQVEIRNLRNFVYRSETGYTPRYDTRVYDLRKIDSAWFIVERFGGLPGIAHTFLSFGFGDDYVAVSVEIRKEKGEQYSPLKGLLREYELMYVVGDERDLIGLRTNYRHDEVYLYPVKTTRERMRRAFVDMLQRANHLAEHPEFYNTLTSTCTTNIVRHVNTIAPHRIPFSMDVVLPAHSDRLAYKLGLIENDQPLEDVRARHRIDPVAQRAGITHDFSKVIRGSR